MQQLQRDARPAQLHVQVRRVGQRRPTLPLASTLPVQPLVESLVAQRLDLRPIQPHPLALDTAPDTEPWLTPTLRATSRCDRFSSSFCRKISRKCRIGSLFVAISSSGEGGRLKDFPDVAALRAAPRGPTLVTLSETGGHERENRGHERRNGRSR